MDFLIELLCGILCCIWESMVESERIPKWGRYILLAIPFAGLTVLLVLGFIYDTEPFVRFFLVLLSIGLIGLLVYLIHHIHSSGILRTARKDDLPEILKMYRSVIGKNGCHWSISYPNEATLHEDFRTGNLYVLWRGSKMIGAGSIVPKNELDDLDCWYYHKNVAEIARIVIRPEYQSKGFGKHLVKKLCYKLNEKGYNAVHILVSTKNHHALNLYRETKFYCKGECQRYDHSYYAFERKL